MARPSSTRADLPLVLVVTITMSLVLQVAVWVSETRERKSHEALSAEPLMLNLRVSACQTLSLWLVPSWQARIGGASERRAGFEKSAQRELRRECRLDLPVRFRS